MDSKKFSSEFQYIERNGCTFNMEEKMKLGLALGELKSDLNLIKVYIIGKVTGKYFEYNISFFIIFPPKLVFGWISFSIYRCPLFILFLEFEQEL